MRVETSSRVMELTSNQASEMLPATSLYNSNLSHTISDAVVNVFVNKVQSLVPDILLLDWSVVPAIERSALILLIYK